MKVFLPFVFIIFTCQIVPWAFAFVHRHHQRQLHQLDRDSSAISSSSTTTTTTTSSSSLRAASLQHHRSSRRGNSSRCGSTRRKESHCTSRYKQRYEIRLFSTPASSESVLPPGVAEFEQWFQSQKGASCSENLRHAMFSDNNDVKSSSLRGLSWTGANIPTKKTRVATVPRDVILSSDFNKENWDAQLACQLWQEIVKVDNSDGSKISGYVSLLTQGSSFSLNNAAAPDSLAPHALRRWTKAQQDTLTDLSESGRQLVELCQQQTKKWKAIFEALPASSRNSCSWEQFEWCMEAVHSRAFCGVSAGAAADGTPQILSLAAPVVAAGAGYLCVSNNVLDDSILVLGPLAVLAALPALLQLLAPSPPQLAVLLPLIDSANHLEEAGTDSSIEFNVIQQAFELNIGTNCVVIPKGESRQQQLYVSYGSKSDAEWLLNYGFLPGMTSSSSSSSSSTDDSNQFRLMLADEFCKRNP